MTGVNDDSSIAFSHQRSSPRVLIDKRVEWNDHAGSTRDIGGGGLFVRTADPPPVGADLALRLALRDDVPPLPVSARVVRSQTAPEPGVALCFAEDQPAARAEIGAFLLALLAREELDVTTEVMPLREPRLIDWEATLERRQEQLTQAIQSMARVREGLRASKRRNEERAEALDRREQLLRAVDEEIQRERLALQREFHERQADLDERSAKLVELAGCLKDERRQLSEREDSLEDRALELDATARQLDETQRQLQVHAFERNLLAQQLQQARSERESLQKQVEILEERLHRGERTVQFVMPNDNTLADRRQPDGVPTEVEPLSGRARVQATMHSARQWLRDFFTNPGS